MGEPLGRREVEEDKGRMVVFGDVDERSGETETGGKIDLSSLVSLKGYLAKFLSLDDDNNLELLTRRKAFHLNSAPSTHSWCYILTNKELRESEWASDYTRNISKGYRMMRRRKANIPSTSRRIDINSTILHGNS